MTIPKRFTLRWEYFGGIVHDARNMICHVLNEYQSKMFSRILVEQMHSSYATQAGISVRELEEEGFDPVDIKKYADMGVLETTQDVVYASDNLRLVSLPILPNHCLSAPIRIYDTYTRRCNLDCKQCYVSSRTDFPETRRTIEQTETIMRKFYEVGTMEWRFTGGEPTSCDDLLEAIAIAKGFGMAVMLNTNGCWNEAMMENIPEAGIDEIIISLEGSEEVNDRRRNPGVFRKIIRALDRIAQHNQDRPDRRIRVTLNMTVARDNVSEVESVIRLGAGYGYNVNFVPLRPYGRTLTDLQGMMLSTEEFMRFSENVQRLRVDPEIRTSGIRIIHKNMDLFCSDYPDKSREPFPFNYSSCGALSTGFGLCSDGRVNACGFLMNDPELLGPSMLDVSVSEAWLHPKMERIRRAKKVGCPQCRFYMNQCEGKCVAMVLANGGRIEAGKLLGRDPYCFGPLMPKA